MLTGMKVKDSTINRIMAERDYSDLERRRVEFENNRNRLIAETSLLPRTLCRLRRCRRSDRCEGPSVPTLHRIEKVRAQRMIELTGAAYKTLPQCLASLSKDTFTKTCLPFEGEQNPARPTKQLRRLCTSMGANWVGNILNQHYGIQSGAQTLDEIWQAEYDAVMQVIRRPEPAAEPDTPEWLAKLEWTPGLLPETSKVVVDIVRETHSRIAPVSHGTSI